MGELEGRILARQLGRHIRLEYATGVCSHTVFHPLFLSLVSLKITVMISDFEISGVSLFVFVSLSISFIYGVIDNASFSKKMIHLYPKLIKVGI
ncbi:unnamed protein product [Lactuca virosa]|uniref:Uncharacterized protein n=1 Tax=Lactuca virosa TaxID=75947 RepID=A0AAU9NXB7_9ASTR|nr:unnamed protein product [Lactuca virosa]